MLKYFRNLLKHLRSENCTSKILINHRIHVSRDMCMPIMILFFLLQWFSISIKTSELHFGLIFCLQQLMLKWSIYGYFTFNCSIQKQGWMKWKSCFKTKQICILLQVQALKQWVGNFLKQFWIVCKLFATISH